jgi:divalent metal cation (Fe/Co/Zn/Cd) transporter
VVGVDFLISSGKRLFAPVPVTGSWLAVAVMLASAVIKEWMARFSVELGRRIESSALAADAWHHRSDAIASALVAVAIPGAALGMNWLDGVFGLGVSALIMYTGVDLIRSSASYLMGESPTEAMVRQVSGAAQSVPGVVASHDIEVHDYGLAKDVSLHIEVSNSETVTRAHQIATQVEEAVSRRVGASVVVHVDPLDRIPGLTAEPEVHRTVAAVLRELREVAGFHALSVSGSNAGDGVIQLHVLVDRHMDVGQSHALSHQINQQVTARLPGYRVAVHIEPSDTQRGSGATDPCNATHA